MRLLFPLVLVIVLIGCVGEGVSETLQPPSPLSQSVSPIKNPLPMRIYLPVVAWPGCYRSPQAVEFARLLTGDSRQQRPVMRCNKALVDAAQRRVESLANERYFGHCDPRGICANEYARAAGCVLPDDYGDGNNIESIAGGSGDAGFVFLVLAQSPSHADHLFGQRDFFRKQDDVGVAYIEVEGSQYRFYWAILIAPCGQRSGE